VEKLGTSQNQEVKLPQIAEEISGKYFQIKDTTSYYQGFPIGF